MKNEIFHLNNAVIELKNALSKFSQSPKATDNPTNIPQNSAYPPNIPTHNPPYNALKPQNISISTGNEGVPTDKQTDQQTNQHIEKGSYNQKGKSQMSFQSASQYLPPSLSSPQENTIDNALQIIESLDNLKKELRLKFKRLTEQELLVFSTLYQLSEEQEYTDYKNLSERLKLTESSIRDYIGRLIKKGIPVDKV
ncbi:MAG TPA: helix-turn-helix domain-containing protein, partial [Patescibacteria group bacterium]|nr:helix-turn-helix domain-containing protein [Patescibacteria group bacterium]